MGILGPEPSKEQSPKSRERQDSPNIPAITPQDASRGDEPPKGGHYDERPERPYFCSSCKRVEYGSYIPRGWYLVQRATGHGGKHLRLGLYCNLRCLMAAHRRLQEGHEEHADRLGLPSDELEGLAAVLERAIDLLHDNLTVRQVGDILEIPTNVLRGWLSAGNICIDDYGRLADLQISDKGQQPPVHTVESFIAERAGKVSMSTVNELAQAGHVRALSWALTTTGPSHKPAFEATVSAIRMDNKAPVTARGKAASKKQARATAATKFLAGLSQ